MKSRLPVGLDARPWLQRHSIPSPQNFLAFANNFNREPWGTEAKRARGLVTGWLSAQHLPSCQPAVPRPQVASHPTPLCPERTDDNELIREKFHECPPSDHLALEIKIRIWGRLRASRPGFLHRMGIASTSAPQVRHCCPSTVLNGGDCHPCCTGKLLRYSLACCSARS